MATATAEDVLIVHEFRAGQRPSSDVVRATIQTYRGDKWIHIRRWYWSEDGPEEELKPGKGLAVRLEQLGELRKAVELLCAAAEKVAA
jgi:hypothetical protein